MSHYPVTVIDVQTPALRGTPVYNEVKKLWTDNELGNDFYYYSWDDEFDEEMPATAKYIADNGITGRILLRFWW
jgi:hypothetical protein